MRAQFVAAATAEDAKTDLPESSLTKLALKRDGRETASYRGDLRDCIGYRALGGLYMRGERGRGGAFSAMIAK